MRKRRIRVRSPENLIAWRKRYGLTQVEAAIVFCLRRRAYQYIEAGNRKKFPISMDQMAKFHERFHKPIAR